MPNTYEARFRLTVIYINTTLWECSVPAQISQIHKLKLGELECLQRRCLCVWGHLVGTGLELSDLKAQLFICVIFFMSICGLLCGRRLWGGISDTGAELCLGPFLCVW